METGINYTNHISLMHKLNNFEGREKYQAPFAKILKLSLVKQ